MSTGIPPPAPTWHFLPPRKQLQMPARALNYPQANPPGRHGSRQLTSLLQQIAEKQHGKNIRATLHSHCSKQRKMLQVGGGGGCDSRRHVGASTEALGERGIILKIHHHLTWHFAAAQRKKELRKKLYPLLLCSSNTAHYCCLWPMAFLQFSYSNA